MRDTGERRRDSAITRPSCAVCGGPGAVLPSDVEAGWFACSYCGSASPIEAAGTRTIEGPLGRVVCVSRPGHTRIQERAGHLGMIVPLIAVLDLALGAVVWLTDRLVPGAHAAVASVVNVLLLLSVAAGFALVHIEHVIEVEPHRVRAFWQWLGRRFDERVGTPAVALKIARGFRLRDPRDLAFVETCVSAALQDAGEPTRAPSGPCPGCGGPVPEPETAGGIVECGYCRARLVHGRESLRLGPLKRTPLPPDAATAVPLPARRGRKQDDPLFVLPSFASRHGTAPVMVAVLILAPFVLAPLGGAAVAWREAGLLPATRLLAALYCAIISAALALGLALVFWSVNLVRVGRHGVTHELRLFGVRLKSITLPIARLIEIDCGLDDGTDKRVWLRLRTPTKVIAIDHAQRPPDGARFLRAVTDALEPALRAAGRMPPACSLHR